MSDSREHECHPIDKGDGSCYGCGRQVICRCSATCLCPTCRPCPEHDADDDVSTEGVAAMNLEQYDCETACALELHASRVGHVTTTDHLIPAGAWDDKTGPRAAEGSVTR